MLVIMMISIKIKIPNQIVIILHVITMMRNQSKANVGQIRLLWGLSLPLISRLQ